MFSCWQVFLRVGPLDGAGQGGGREDYWIKTLKIPQLGEVESNRSRFLKCS